MIHLTRLDGREFVLNGELVATVERTPDTVVTTTTGERFVVKESVDEVVERALAYRRGLLGGCLALRAAVQPPGKDE
jgi:flagellar protein FlbD